jgi:hypothetical protein
LALRVVSPVRLGQKATAVLLVLLLESDAPLLVDQPGFVDRPEDDLDNRFIADVGVSRTAERSFPEVLVITDKNRLELSADAK